MTRAEMMRAAREVVQVTFTEYLRIRTHTIPTLVFLISKKAPQTSNGAPGVAGNQSSH